MYYELKAEEVYKRSSLKHNDNNGEQIKFRNVQAGATEAIEFGLEMLSEGYNIFALGEAGLGKHEIISAITRNKALTEEVPKDYVYVYNFKDPDSPIYLELPPKKGSLFARDMDELVESLRKEIPKIFESKEYENEKNQIIEKFQEFDRQVFDLLTEEAKGRGFSLERGVDGFIFLPIKENEVLDEEKFSKLPESEKKQIQEKIKILQGRLKEAIKLVKEAEKETKKKILELEKRVAYSAVSYHIEELKEKYNYNEKIIEYLKLVQEDILNNLDDFKQAEMPVPANMALRLFKPEPSFIRYKVNIFIDRSEQKGAPVIYETNPNAFNLIGKVEYRFQMGMAVTDFTLIKPGALHRANGGYLILDALDLFKNPFSYDIIKRAIKNREIKIEDPLESYRLSSGTLKPEAIPLSVKVVIIGSPFIYYILYHYDEEFNKIFKVKADFERDMDWNEEAEANYALFINQLAEREGLLPFDVSGIQRVIEYGGRLVEDQKKLSIKIEDISALVREASFYAKKSGKEKVYREDVYEAIKKRKERHGKIEKHIQELIMRDVFLISSEGEKVGTINGLSVYDLGDYSFGRPSRITAKVSVGKEGVVHIDREVKLSGKIHDKGSMIMSAYLNSKFGLNESLSFSATISFEQLYGMVEGDSATLAEVIVLQSAIGNIPIKQYIAITGSMNQHGEAQAIGGVNEKIEGFFAVCKERGLKGNEGVVIPRSNIQHLMLNEEVREAIEKGLFHIYAVESVEEAMEIMTGLKAGEQNEKGEYPEGTANYLIMKGLKTLKEKGQRKEEKDKQKRKREENGKEG
ncbi:MAG: ATP-binding protein [bacterium]